MKHLVGAPKTAEAKAKPRLPHDYIVALGELADNEENRRFLNGSNDEASIVTWLMIRHATEDDEVLIYSKALSPLFYAEILRAASIQPLKCRFRIVLDDKEGMKVVKALPVEIQSHVDCRYLLEPEGGHFLVFDDAFRYEIKDHHDELSVVCNFSERETAQKLRSGFERRWEKSASCQVLLDS